MLIKDALKRIGLAMVLVVTMAAAGCDDEGGGGSNVSDIPEAKSNAQRLQPNLSDEEMAAFTHNNNAFALELYHELAEENDGKNIFYSPYSISTAMGMVWAGAEGDTESEMAGVLHFEGDEAKVHEGFDQLLLRYDEASEEFTLKVANAIWAQDGWNFLQSFLDTLAQYYGAGIKLADFEADPEKWRRIINDWVEDHTNGRIEDLLPEGSVTEYTKMVLVNAIYFYGKWLNEFHADYTSQGTFHTPSGNVTVDFMNDEIPVRAATGMGWTAIELPYKNQDYAMLLIVPDATAFDRVEDELDATFIEDVVASLVQDGWAISMPKFEFTFGANLKNAFEAMGMEKPFSPDADFSGMDGRRDLVITGVYHKAFVKVDEEGTEAAAATGVVVGNTAAPLHSIVIDRPFFVFIRDTVTGQILFAGRVLDPSAQ